MSLYLEKTIHLLGQRLNFSLNQTVYLVIFLLLVIRLFTTYQVVIKQYH